MLLFARCGVVVLAIFSTSGKAASESDEKDGVCHADVASVLTGSLVQKQIHTTIKAKIKEWTGMDVKGGDSAFLSSLLHGAGVESLKVSMSEDNRSADVSLGFAGREWNYDLSAFSVFSEGAKETHVSDSGTEVRVLQPSRSFRSQRKGSKASAILHEDGSVSGLFEVGFQTLQVEPLDITSTTQDMSLIAMAKAKHNPHRLHRVDLQGIFSQPMPSPFEKSSLLQQDSWAKKPPNETPNETGHMPHPSEEDEKEYEMEQQRGGGSWTGTPWWPGCYPGDNVMNEFQMGVVIDVPLVEKLGAAKAKSMIEEVFVKASFAYEKQLHFALKILWMNTFSSASSAPDYARGCSGAWTGQPFNGIDNKYRSMQGRGSKTVTGLEDAASIHLFTGCGNGYGVTGLAAQGACDDNKQFSNSLPTIAVNQMNEYKNHNGAQAGSDVNWIIMAHELGHNLNMAHSFEQGQGRTGGIMDYGDGKINGEFQFNTRYRKAKTCKWLTDTTAFENQQQCRGFFSKAGSGNPAPAPPAGGGGGCPSTCYSETCDHWINSPEYMTFPISCSMLSTDHSCDCSGCSCPTLCRKTCFDQTCDHWIGMYPTFEGASLTHTVLQNRFSCDCSGCTR